MWCELLRQRLGVQDRLRRTIRPDWPHRMRRIAQQCDSSARPSWQRIAIDHREFKHRRCAPNDVGNIQPGKTPVGIALAEQRAIDFTIPVAARRRLIQRHLYRRHPVQSRPALLPQCFRNRIGDEFLRIIAHPHHAASGEHRFGFGDTAPHHATGKARLAFIRIELPTHHRMNAIGSDQGRASDRWVAVVCKM